jgi:hypothetical protein
MGKTTFRRTSFCLTQESQRQLDELCAKFGENPSQVITRALQLIHFSLRFPNIPSEIEEIENASQCNI